MAETLYDVAEDLRTQILSSSDREKTAADFFSNRGYALKKEDVVVLDDGTPIIRDDQGRNYDRQQLQQLKDDISGQLSLFSEEDLPRQDPGRGNARKGEEGSGRDARKVRNVSGRQNPILRDGVSAYYSHEKGWNGKEQHPWTVKGAWDKFGFVDFLGMQVRNVHDVAQMFSIYRNPMIEYFHIILEKQGRIVHQIAMTSGLSGLVRVIPACGMEQLKEDILKYDFDAVYLVHNHPSGDPSPSDDDIRSTAFYVNEIFKKKFIGHIILDHDRFTLISAMKPTIRTGADIAIDAFKYTPHEIPKKKPRFNQRICSPSDVARIVFSLHNEGNIVLDLDNEHKVRSVSPFSIDDYDPIKFMYEMKDNCIRDRVIIVTSNEDYRKIHDTFKCYGERTGKPYKQPILDCIYVDAASGFYQSMLEEGAIEPINWQGLMAKGLLSSDFIWDEDISDHPKQGYLFETIPYYSSGILKPSWKELDSFNEHLSSYAGKGAIKVLDASDVLETIGYPPGKVVISESAIRNARSDARKSEIITALPKAIVDPVAVIDTGARTDKDRRNCLLFVCNALVDGCPATVGMLVEPVEKKRRTEYVVQTIFPPDEMCKEDSRLFTVCAMNNQFIYSDLEKPCFIIHETDPDKPISTTKVDLPNEIPHKKAVINHQIDKAISKTRQETRR